MFSTSNLSSRETKKQETKDINKVVLTDLLQAYTIPLIYNRTVCL